MKNKEELNTIRKENANRTSAEIADEAMEQVAGGVQLYIP